MWSDFLTVARKEIQRADTRVGEMVAWRAHLLENKLDNMMVA
jgi:hypothetical protein